MGGTWYTSLDSHLSLSFNSEDGGVYCSWLFTCFTKVYIKLCQTLLKDILLWLNWLLAKKNKCRQFAICNLQFCKLPALPPTYKVGQVVRLTCQYDPDFQGIRISHATLESIHLNKSINCKEPIKIFTIKVFCFNLWYYSISQIWFSTLEMLSLHYVMHASCPVLVLWVELQMSTKKTIPMSFHPWFISLISES